MAKKTYIDNAIFDYMTSISLRNHPILEYGQELTKQEIGIDMQSPLEQLQFYAWLTQTTQPQHVLELGTFSGLATLAIAERLGANGHISTVDHNDRFVTTAKKIWQQASTETQNKITLIQQKAVDSLHHMIKQKQIFDMIIIDANKSQILEYYELAHHIARPGTIIIIDNILFSGRVLDVEKTLQNNTRAKTTKERNHRKYAQQIHKTNIFIHQDTRVLASSLVLGDGITIATVI